MSTMVVDKGSKKSDSQVPDLKVDWSRNFIATRTSRSDIGGTFL